MVMPNPWTAAPPVSSASSDRSSSEKDLPTLPCFAALIAQWLRSMYWRNPLIHCPTAVSSPGAG
jgi:hypothetical protein